jgi:hypothetical protein
LETDTVRHRYIDGIIFFVYRRRMWNGMIFHIAAYDGHYRNKMTVGILKDRMRPEKLYLAAA